MKNNISEKREINNRKVEKITEEFSGKNITRFGGAGLIRRFFKRHKIKTKLSEVITVEGRRGRKYGTGTMFISFLYGIFLGYSRPYHMKVLIKDRVFQKLAGLHDFPVQSTISRFFSCLKINVAHQIAEFNFDFLMNFRKGFEKFKSLTLDMDSHVTPVYGNQQRTGIGYNPKKKGRRSYHSLLCFVGETRDYIAGLLRNGKHHTSYNAIPFLKGIVKRLPAHIEKIRLRADSGFFSLNMLQFLIKQSIEFYIVVPMQPWVQRKIGFIGKWRSIGRGVDVAECEYVLSKDIMVRMVVIRQKIRKGHSPKKQLKLLYTEDVIYDYQVIVTNSPICSAEVWRFYNKRACCENFIKEGMYSFGLDKVISHSYAGNYAYFELLMLGYNLMNFFKEEVLNQKKIKNMTQTIREKFFLIPGKLVGGSRKLILKLERTWFGRKEYEEALARVT